MIDILDFIYTLLPMHNNEEELAESLYNFMCANRKDNLTKDGLPGDPRKSGCLYKDLVDPAKYHYLSMIKWHLLNQPSKD